jgi:DNA repair exonuclease SbcCD nuclease subunit
MTEFRFIHTSDLHLGRRFGNLPEAVRGRLVEARHQIIARLAQAARDHGAAHILVAGDVFETETPSDQVWRQALAAMAADAGLHWWLIPGNHDSLAAESLWQRFRAQAAENIHLLDTAIPVEIAPGAMLLPCPAPQRYPGRDLTRWLADCVTDPHSFRIGLAHGAVQNFDAQGARADDVIPPDRAALARLDYLALGDWHGQLAIGARTWYSGTPERDGFSPEGRGSCLAVTLTGPTAAPGVETIWTGAFSWSDTALPLLAGQDAAAALLALLPQSRPDRRNHLIRIRAQGRATLAGHAALHRAAEAVAPEFCFFELDAAALQTEFESADLDAIDRGGALRLAADNLSAAAQDPGRTLAARRISAAALNRLYGYLREGGA